MHVFYPIIFQQVLSQDTRQIEMLSQFILVQGGRVHLKQTRIVVLVTYVQTLLPQRVGIAYVQVIHMR